MNISSSFRRLLLGAGLALAALAPAALSGAAQAAAPPTLGPIQIKAAGTSAAVTVTSAEPVSVRVDAKATAPVTAFPRSQTSEIYTTAHALTLTGLDSNTTYSVTVTARALDGRTTTAQASVTTLKKRVRITLESIDITDDGDLIGDGEPAWQVHPAWDGGAVRGCYPVRCSEEVKVGEGRITPTNTAGETLTFLFAEENFDRFPAAISLKVSAFEDDGVLTGEPIVSDLVDCIANGGCTTGDDGATVVWRVPQGAETAVQTLKVSADDDDTGFRSVMNFAVVLFHNDTPYPAPQRNRPSSNWK